MSKSAVCKLCNLKENHDSQRKKTTKTVGHPRALTKRDERKLVRAFKSLRDISLNLTVKDIIMESGLHRNKVKRRTVSNYLNKLGYRHLQARKKGLLSNSDKKLRLKYARDAKNILKECPNFYTHHVSFYLDGLSFVHKYNPFNVATQPKSRVWRKRGEGLNITAKGSKELAGGRQLHVMVAVAYGKGVILKEAYEKMDGPFFANFVQENLNLCFAKAGTKVQRKHILVMDNCPC